jgi:hypothetical protein
VTISVAFRYGLDAASRLAGLSVVLAIDASTRG